MIHSLPMWKFLLQAGCCSLAPAPLERKLLEKGKFCCLFFFFFHRAEVAQVAALFGAFSVVVIC